VLEANHYVSTVGFSTRRKTRRRKKRRKRRKKKRRRKILTITLGFAATSAISGYEPRATILTTSPFTMIAIPTTSITTAQLAERKEKFQRTVAKQDQSQVEEADKV